MGDVMAKVGAILKTSASNRLVVYLYDFDPATDEVIVVKKDAARVWVEGMERHRYLHASKPTWREIEWTDSMSVADIGGLLPCIANHDCVEFVAVKTHRPSVAEPVPEAVPELSDKAKVKAVYPDAIHGRVSKCIKSGLDFLSESFSDPDEAWADAARRLNTETKPVDHHNFGCGVEVVSGAVLAN